MFNLLQRVWIINCKRTFDSGFLIYQFEFGHLKDVCGRCLTYNQSHLFGTSQNYFNNNDYANNMRYEFSRSLKKKEYNANDLFSFEKNFYEPHSNVVNRSKDDIQQYLQLNNVKIDGINAPNPIFSFEESGLPHELLQHISSKNFQQPTVIQAVTFPTILSGRDMVGIAQTGSGKTLAYLAPAFVHISRQRNIFEGKGDGPIALVLCPTRELTQQVANVTMEFGQPFKISHAVAYGGNARSNQLMDLQRNPEVLIACPGRLKDFLSSSCTDMNRCTYLVIDEADRMLDMGFEPQIREIVDQIRPDRQTVMFSATWPKEVRSLANDFLTDSIFVNVGSLDLAANHNIRQIVHVMNSVDKLSRLVKLLDTIFQDPKAKVLIFATTKATCDNVAWRLMKYRLKSFAIHGDKSQFARDRALNGFRSGEIPILVATDVAQRGLDVDDITAVINFDYPMCGEDYIHRIGRTGRVNKTGTAYTFMTIEDARNANDLIKIMQEAKQNIPDELMSLSEMGVGQKGGRGRFGLSGGRGFRNLRPNFREFDAPNQRYSQNRYEMDNFPRERFQYGRR